MPREPLVLGSRRTALALAQSELVAAPLRRARHAVEVVAMHTAGDRSLGGSLATAKGLFTAELDRALVEGEVDLVVHSLKDLPLEAEAPGLVTAAIPRRERPNDLLLVRDSDEARERGAVPLAELAAGRSASIEAARAFEVLGPGDAIGTSSPRRQAGALALRPDLVCVAVRGSVERRLARLIEGAVDALLLAEAGVVRLWRAGGCDEAAAVLAFRLELATWPAAPGQGALAVKARANGTWHDHPSLRELDDEPTRRSVVLERRLLAELGGGCALPLGATADATALHVALAAPDWRRRAGAGRPPSIVHRSFALHGLDPSSAARALYADAERAALDEPPRCRALRLDAAERAPDAVITTGLGAASRLVSQLPAGGDFAALEVTVRLATTEPWPVDRIELGEDRRRWPWVLVSSPTAAEILVEHAQRETEWLRLGWCALGEGTARALLELGVPAGLCARGRDAPDLATFALRHLDPAAPLFLPQSSRAPPELADRLRAGGREVHSFVAYTVEPRADLRWPPGWPAPRVVLFTSPSAAAAWASAELPWPETAWAIGATTADALRRLGLAEVAEAPAPTARGIAALAGATDEERPS